MTLNLMDTNLSLGFMSQMGRQVSIVLTLGGTDNLTGQAVLFAAAQEPLIGEETYAGGAYLGAGPMHIASLYAQDILRWVLIGLIVIGAILKLFSVL